MKHRHICKIVLALALIIMGSTACKKNNSTTTAPTVYYDQAAQVGRPAINIVFIPKSGKNSFNTTIPTQMPALFAKVMKTSLLTLNPGYTTDLLGVTADRLIGVLSTDVLNVSTSGVTSFYNRA